MVAENSSIVYFEDDTNSRMVMDILLRSRLGLKNVNIFPDSQDYETRLKSISPRPDVIFLDIHMKPHTGFEILTSVRQMPEFEGIPVIALTASVTNDEIHQLQKAGFNGCMAKPLDRKVFPDLLDRILKGEHIWRVTA
jgi:CheY-like chemotaxis protein